MTAEVEAKIRAVDPYYLELFKTREQCEAAIVRVRDDIVRYQSPEDAEERRRFGFSLEGATIVLATIELLRENLPE